MKNNDIFDLFNIDDVPEDLTQDIHLTNTEKVEILLKYANRPLTTKELIAGLYRKYGVSLSQAYVYMSAKSLKDFNLIHINSNDHNKRKFLYSFAYPSKVVKTKSDGSDFTIDHVIDALTYASSPVTLTQLVICFYKLFGVVVHKKNLSSKIASHLNEGKITKSGNTYFLSDLSENYIEPNENLFRINGLYKEDSDDLKRELDYALNNGQGAIIELLSMHDSLSIDDIIRLLKDEYGMIKTYSYVSKALRGMRDKQNFPIVVENKIVKMEKAND